MAFVPMSASCMGYVQLVCYEGRETSTNLYNGFQSKHDLQRQRYVAHVLSD